MTKTLKFFYSYVVGCMLLLPSFLLAQQQTGQVIEKIVAKVDNEIILKSELDLAYLQFKESSSFAPGNLRCKVLETIIINKLLVAKAAIDSVVVEKEAVDQQLDSRMKMLIQAYGGTEELLAQQYGKTVQDLKSELREQVHEQMLVQKMQGKITSDINITPAEVKQFFSSIPKDSLPFLSTEMEIGQIVKLPIIGTKEKEEKKNQLIQIRSRILAGESFADLAKTYSQDPGSAANGGELGFFKRKELVPEYEAAALNLKPGDISMPVESKFGLHIIQLIEKRGNEYNSKHILLKFDASQEDLQGATQLLDSLRTLILSDSISFSKAAYDHSDESMTRNNGGYFLDPNTNSSRVAAEDLDPSLYFLVDKMKEGEISEPLPYTLNDKQAVRIVYLKAKHRPHEANLQDDYQKIYSAALSEKKNKAVNKWFDSTKQEVFITVTPEFKTCKILQNE